jgi:hypothetical protein
VARIRFFLVGRETDFLRALRSQSGLSSATWSFDLKFSPTRVSAELARGQMTVATGKQPALLWRNAGVTPFRPRLPPLPQQVEDLATARRI